jgi:hypothetical protein
MNNMAAVCENIESNRRREISEKSNVENNEISMKSVKIINKWLYTNNNILIIMKIEMKSMK